MARNSLIKDLTFGAFGSTIDLLLWLTFLTRSSIGRSGPAGITEAFREADELLEKINHNTLSATFRQLFKKRLLTYKKRGNLYNLEITNFGKKRLSLKLPKYLSERPWDRRIYLITYDIPEKARRKRDLLRYYLRQISCRLFQESIWITPYNPRQIINGWVGKLHIPGTVIVSDVGQDGGIGETTLPDLIVRLYRLEELNTRYEEFIQKARDKKSSVKQLLLKYLSILKDDPQLPFELLPQSFLGEKAHLVYLKLLKT